jgi:tRNA pseudouridine13 synthase
VRHRRAGITTQDLAHRLARCFGLRRFDVGVAGLKDKVAVAEQTFSLPLPKADLVDVARRVSEVLPGEVLWVRRHANKLRRGHLLGNRFDVLLRGARPGSVADARAIGARLGEIGLPNFYGEQRLGPEGRNVAKGRQRLADGARDWLANLHRTAWQADAFNTWLAERLFAGTASTVLVGDVAKRMDHGALFDVVDAGAEAERAARLEITPTGPLFGRDMRRASGEPGQDEERVLAATGVAWDALERSRLQGSRRAARVPLLDFVATEEADGLRIAFRLPKGSYATVVLREFSRDATE